MLDEKEDSGIIPEKRTGETLPEDEVSETPEADDNPFAFMGDIIQRCYIIKNILLMGFFLRLQPSLKSLCGFFQKTDNLKAKDMISNET